MNHDIPLSRELPVQRGTAGFPNRPAFVTMAGIGACSSSDRVWVKTGIGIESGPEPNGGFMRRHPATSTEWRPPAVSRRVSLLMAAVVPRAPEGAPAFLRPGRPSSWRLGLGRSPSAPFPGRASNARTRSRWVSGLAAYTDRRHPAVHVKVERAAPAATVLFAGTKCPARRARSPVPVVTG